MLEKPHKIIKVGEGKISLSKEEVERHEQTEKMKEKKANEALRAAELPGVHEINEEEVKESEKFVDEVKEKGDEVFL